MALSQDQEAAVRRLHADGLGRNAIAKETGINGRTVSRFCALEGLTFDGHKTRAATQATMDTAAQLRAELELKLLREAHRHVDIQTQPALVFNFGGKDNTYEEHTLDHLPSQDQLAHMRAAALALDKSLRITELERPGTRAAINLLSSLAAALGVADVAPE
ncbi:hypothetical protein [Tessaracoccus sp.]